MRKLNYYIWKQLKSWRNHLDLMIYGLEQLCIVLEYAIIFNTSLLKLRNVMSVL
uniref:Uncharacterized protein n=1 Tax=Arundo donax TaxID=35708 RepID=A0A0A9G4P9_ARUDO